jgi:molecular chaperone DnaJ
VVDTSKPPGAPLDDLMARALADDAPLPPHADERRFTFDLTLAESIEGCARDLSYRRRVRCPVCDGTRCAPGTSSPMCPDCGRSGRHVRQRAAVRVTTPCGGCEGRGVLGPGCAACKDGSVARDEALRVTLPAGVRDGATRRLEGMGDLGADLATADALIEVRVATPIGITLDGDHLHATLYLSADELRGGGRFQVVGPLGDNTVEVLAGSRDGEVVAQRGGGLPSRESPSGDGGYRAHVGRGDFLVTLRERRAPSPPPSPLRMAVWALGLAAIAWFALRHL